MAEGKGFVGHVSNNRALLQHTRVQNAAEHGTPRNPKGLGISEILIAPRAPWQVPFAERLIGSIRRECLDHVIVINERHLRRLCAGTSRTTTPPARISPSTTTALIRAKSKRQRAGASWRSRRSADLTTPISAPPQT